MKILFLLFLACGIYAYYGGLEQRIIHATLMQEEVEYTVTSVYQLLSLLPLVILFKKKQILQFIFLGVIFVYLVLSAKRGAIILGGFATTLLIMSSFTGSSLGKKFSIALTTITFLIAVYFFISYQMESNSYLALRVQQTFEGYSSGREEYAQTVLDYYHNSTNILQMLFGIGAQGTLSANVSFAHNDWLAVLLEQGIFGLCLYALYWAGFVFTWIKSRVNFDAFVVIGLLIIIGLGKTMFSMYYLPISPEMMASSGFYAIILGYYLAKAFPQEDQEVSNEQV